MRTRLMLEALAAWLALAAASGQACASTSIQAGANRVFGASSVLTMGVNPMVADPEPSLYQITTPFSDEKVPASGVNANVALLTSTVTARKVTPNRAANAVHAPAQLKRRVALNQHEVVGAPRPQAILVAANGRNGLDSEKFYLIANAKLAPVPVPPGPAVPVPEPGNWATVLAGLLGVIAIARRRMSL